MCPVLLLVLSKYNADMNILGVRAGYKLAFGVLLCKWALPSGITPEFFPEILISSLLQ